MGNMSYCRFQNTLSDLQDCENVLDDFNSLDDLKEELSYDEFRAAKKMIAIAKNIANNFDEE